MAAVLASGRGAVLSHRSAAGLWRLTRRPSGPIEVTRAKGWRAPAGVSIHRGLLPADESLVVDGIPTTSVSRTILDLASLMSRAQVESVLNEAEVRGITGKLSIPDLLERYPRRPGTAVLREVLSDRIAMRGITRSALEDRFVALLAESDLPRPRLNAAVAVRGRFFEVDCLWPERRVIVELDGRRAHGTVRAFERDRERDRLLLADGWGVARVTWRQLRDDAPAVVADLRDLMRG